MGCPPKESLRKPCSVSWVGEAVGEAGWDMGKHVWLTRAGQAYPVDYMG